MMIIAAAACGLPIGSLGLFLSFSDPLCTGVPVTILEWSVSTGTRSDCLENG